MSRKRSKQSVPAITREEFEEVMADILAAADIIENPNSSVRCLVFAYGIETPEGYRTGVTIRGDSMAQNDLAIQIIGASVDRTKRETSRTETWEDGGVNGIGGTD